MSADSNNPDDKLVSVSTKPITRWWKRTSEVETLKKELAKKDKELKKLTKQQKMRELVEEVVDKAFERNKQRTRLTCWYCDRAIDESKGYSTWVGCRLHSECVEPFQDKVKPIIQTNRNEHSNFLLEGLPVFTVEAKP